MKKEELEQQVSETIAVAQRVGTENKQLKIGRASCRERVLRLV